MNPVVSVMALRMILSFKKGQASGVEHLSMLPEPHTCNRLQGIKICSLMGPVFGRQDRVWLTCYPSTICLKLDPDLVVFSQLCGMADQITIPLARASYAVYQSVPNRDLQRKDPAREQQRRRAKKDDVKTP